MKKFILIAALFASCKTTCINNFHGQVVKKRGDFYMPQLKLKDLKSEKTIIVDIDQTTYRNAKIGDTLILPWIRKSGLK